MPGGGGPTGTDQSASACACPATSAAGHGSLRRRRLGGKAGLASVAAGARPGLDDWRTRARPEVRHDRPSEFVRRVVEEECRRRRRRQFQSSWNIAGQELRVQFVSRRGNRRMHFPNRTRLRRYVPPGPSPAKRRGRPRSAASFLKSRPQIWEETGEETCGRMDGRYGDVAKTKEGGL